MPSPASILGQERALEIIATALGSGRFHHAWIFSGPRGVGKFTTAMQVARVLLDPEASPSQAVAPDLSIQNPKSKVQNLIDSSTHPDLHIIRKEDVLYSEDRQLRERKQLNIPIGLLRERVIGGKSGETYYEAPAYRTAALGHGKVFIIDQAELLTPDGQDAMLKTLEEPPAQTYIFLITSQPDRLLPTIRSRAQHVRFGRLDEKAMREWMKGVLSVGSSQLSAKKSKTDEGSADEREATSTGNSQPTTDNLAWVEQFAEGSPGIAELAIEYGFHQWQKTLQPMLGELDEGKFPTSMGETMAGLVDEFAQAWVKSHKNASKDAANKDGARHLFALLGAHARGQLREAAVSDQRSAVSGNSTALDVIDVIRQAEREMESNVNLKLLLENLVVQWARVAAPEPVGAR